MTSDVYGRPTISQTGALTLKSTYTQLTNERSKVTLAKLVLPSVSSMGEPLKLYIHFDAYSYLMLH